MTMHSVNCELIVGSSPRGKIFYGRSPDRGAAMDSRVIGRGLKARDQLDKDGDFVSAPDFFYHWEQFLFFGAVLSDNFEKPVYEQVCQRHDAGQIEVKMGPVINAMMRPGFDRHT